MKILGLERTHDLVGANVNCVQRVVPRTRDNVIAIWINKKMVNQLGFGVTESTPIIHRRNIALPARHPSSSDGFCLP